MRLRIPGAHLRRCVAERQFAAGQAAGFRRRAVQAERLVQFPEQAFDDGGCGCEFVLGFLACRGGVRQGQADDGSHALKGP